MIVIIVILAIALIIANKWSLELIRNKENVFAVLFLIVTNLLAIVLAIVLGCLLNTLFVILL